MTHEDIFKSIAKELELAKKKHPFFPGTAVAMTAIVAEEMGEAIQAANDIEYTESADFEKLSELEYHLRKELLQTAAMCVRCLEQLED